MHDFYREGITTTSNIKSCESYAVAVVYVNNKYIRSHNKIVMMKIKDNRGGGKNSSKKAGEILFKIFGNTKR
jgi:hypothetical protein